MSAQRAQSIEVGRSPTKTQSLPSFAQVYAQYFSFVWRTTRSLGVPPELLDDAVQDVFLIVHRQLATFEQRSSLSTWLFGIVHNVSRNYQRRKQRKGPGEPLSEQLLNPAPSPELVRQGFEAWDEVLGFLETLDERDRTIFVCSLLEQMSATETAETAQVDPAVVYARVRALRNSFREQLKRSLEVPA